MNTLAPKLILTPLLIASTTWAGRRWGHALSGWLVALPLTSGPIALFIALDYGVATAQQSASGSLLGAVAQIAFCAGYMLASLRTGWILSLAAGSIAYAAVAVLMPPLVSPIIFGLLVAAVALFLLAFRRAAPGPRVHRNPPAWDIPARVVVATTLVVLISASAPIVGGRGAGILATFPVYASVLATFAHAAIGREAAADVLRGLGAGLVGFGAFFLALGWLLGMTGIAESFALALLVGIGVQAATLPVLRGAMRRMSS